MTGRATPHTDALVARLHEFGESSAVALLLTSGRGAVRVLAKGAKRLRNSFAGPLDKGALYRVRLGRRSGEGLVLLHASTLREPFPRLRRDPGRFAAATFVLEVAAHLLRENEPQPELFRLTVFCLKVVERAPARRLALALAFFLTRAVALSGHAPRLDGCAACGRPVSGRERALLSPARGGLLHASCARGEPGSRPLSPAGRRLLARLEAAPPGEALGMGAPAAAGRELVALLTGWLEYLLECRIRSTRGLARALRAAGVSPPHRRG
ncbi:MAG: DNA repair protein RecO [Planctomycetota bacterium]